MLTVPPSTTPTQIVFTCVDIRGDKCRTGWEGPIEVAIHRGEVHDAIERRTGRQQ